MRRDRVRQNLLIMIAIGDVPLDITSSHASRDREPRNMFRTALILLVLMTSFAGAAELRHFSTDEGLAAVRLCTEAENFYAAKEIDKSRDTFLKVLALPLQPEALAEVMPEMAKSYYNVACEYAVQGDSESALHYLDSAITFGFDDAASIAADSDLNNIRATPKYKHLEALAKKRKVSRAEIGRLLILQHTNQLALSIPPSTSCRERVLPLACSAEQAKRLEKYRLKNQAVELHGSGGTWNTNFVFTVTSIKVPKIPVMILEPEPNR
jgi:hypothetical protein